MIALQERWRRLTQRHATLNRLNGILERFEPTGDAWVLRRLSDAAFDRQLSDRGSTGVEPWRSVAIERELARRGAREAGRAANRIAILALALSALPYVADGVEKYRQPANDRRCEAIQKDMLSARPQRSDSPDLFQALGCQPQGEGSVYVLAKRKRS